MICRFKCSRCGWEWGKGLAEYKDKRGRCPECRSLYYTWENWEEFECLLDT